MKDVLFIGGVIFLGAIIVVLTYKALRRNAKPKPIQVAGFEPVDGRVVNTSKPRRPKGWYDSLEKRYPKAKPSVKVNDEYIDETFRNAQAVRDTVDDAIHMAAVGSNYADVSADVVMRQEAIDRLREDLFDKAPKQSISADVEAKGSDNCGDRSGPQYDAYPAYEAPKSSDSGSDSYSSHSSSYDSGSNSSSGDSGSSGGGGCD